MFSMTLFKKDVKDSLRFWCLITGVLVLFIVSFLMLGNMGGGPRGGGNSMGDIMLQQFYSMFAILLPMIFITSTANKLIAAQVDRGSLAYVMAHPIKRIQVSMTQGLFLASSLVAMFGLITVAGTVVIIATGATLELKAFILLNVGALLLNLTASGISYFASCTFNTSRLSMAIGAGIPVVFFVFNMLANMGVIVENMEIFKYFTIYTLFNQAEIMAYNSNIIWQFFILLGILAVGYVAGNIVFKRKDLPL